MEDESFKIYVDQLRNGETKEVDEQCAADFLDVSEENLSYIDPVTIKGEAYVATDTLVLHFALTAYARIPCSICNSPVKVEVQVDDFYHAEPLEEIKTGIYNFKEVVREAIILDTPLFAECNEGNCSSRKEIKKYLKQEEDPSSEDRYHPFANL